jgi:hypothetical protein
MISIENMRGTSLIFLGVFGTILAYTGGDSYAAVPNTQAVAQVLAGERKTAYVSWWGYDPNDATASLQAAIDSGADKVIVEDMKSPWIVRPIKLASDQELVLAEGVVLLAKRGEFRDSNACLLSASGKRNVRISGPGATLRMWRDDYDAAPYEKAEWRHAISIRSCTNVSVIGLTIVESGGDGIYLGVFRDGVTNTNVEIRDVVCDRNYRQGIRVISAKNLLIENTVLRNTTGTPPMAGIDFEPNHSSEMLVNCVMRTCLIEGNSGDGFLLALHNLTDQSQPISIRIENCRSVGNRNGFRLNTGNGGPRTCVPGSIEVVDCHFETSEQAGILVSNKTPEGCSLMFRTCRVVEPASDQVGLSPIMFATSSDSTLNVGGVEFTDVVISNSRDRLPIGYNDRAGGLKLVQLGGTLTVEREGQKTAYPLDQKTLDEWFPFQAFKQFPPFNMAALNWQWTLPEAQPQSGWNCAVRQRGHGEFMFWADAGQEITFTLELKRVGKSSAPETSVTVRTPSGELKSLSKMTDEGKQAYTFKVTQAGPHRIVCESGRSTVQVVSSNLSISLYSERATFHLLGRAGDLYFCVPVGVEEFGVRLNDAGGSENVRVAVYDADDRKVGEKDNIEGHQFLLHRSRPTETEIWRLQFSKPSQGIIEDYYVHLQGIPPFLATHPEALPKPVNTKPQPSKSLPRLKVSKNGRFLVTEDGKPFFWLGDTAWFIMRLSDDEIRYYLSNRVRKGFTGIQVDLNAYAWTNLVLPEELENPYLNDNPDMPNETYWRRVDWMVDEAGRSGLYVLLTPMWGKHCPRYVGNDTGKARRLGRWLGSRYRDRTHVMWFVSGEYDSINRYRTITPEQKAILNAVAQGLEDGHGGTQLMTIHPGGRRTSSKGFHNEAWLDFNMLQSGHFDNPEAVGLLQNYTLVTNDYNRTPIKPVFDAEPAYEDMIDGYFRGPRDGSGSRMYADVMRRKAYWAVFAGGFGHTYGHTDVQIFWSPGKPKETANRNHWRDALEAPGAGQMRYLRSLIESLSFLDRIPDQSVIASSPGSGKDHVCATRDSEGSYAMIYLPTGRTVTINMRKIPGPEAKALWFDPRSGHATVIGRFPCLGTREFKPPPKGAGNDWVLVLEAT